MSDELTNVTRCPNCGRDTVTGATFCASCGAAIYPRQTLKRYVPIWLVVILILIALPFGLAGACGLVAALVTLPQQGGAGFAIIALGFAVMCLLVAGLFVGLIFRLHKKE